MFNAWDFVLITFLIVVAWLGWTLKSLPLLGAGFSTALAPVAADLWKNELGHWLLDTLGGRGLSPHQDEIAWWLILVAAGTILMLLFLGLSKVLAQIKLEFLDRSFGAFLTAAIFLAVLSLNFGMLAGHLSGKTRRGLIQSWCWAHLRVSKEPIWLENIQQKVESLKLP